MQVGELFGGIGGLAEGFKKAGFSIAWANDFDKNACTTYRANHNHLLIEEDIKKIDAKSLPAIDVLTGGFPCQAFSIAGYGNGFNDHRGELFFDVVRFLRDLQPKSFLLENVKGLLSHDDGRTFSIVLSELKSLGYTITHKVLRTSNYCDVPQKRERVYIIGFLNKFNAYNFSWPSIAPCKISWWDILEDNPDPWYNLTCSSYRAIVDQICKLEPRTIYAFRHREVDVSKDGLAPTVTCRKDRGELGWFLTDDCELRTFTLKERFKLQGFREDFILPSEVSRSQLIKQIGNSVSVPIISLLASEIKRVLEVDYSSFELVLRA